MLDVVDQVFPTVLEKVLHTTPQSEKVLHSSTSVRKNCWLPEIFKFTCTLIKSIRYSFCQLFSGPLGNVDILVVNERLSGNMDKETGEQLNVALHSLFWSSLMAGLLNKWYLPELCPSALQFSWPNVFNRLLTVYSLIDSGYEHVII